MPEQSPSPPQVEVTISWKTILKVLTGCLLAYLAMRLFPLLELLFLALLIAITLSPIVGWTRRQGWPDRSGVSISALVLSIAVTLFAGILVPTIVSQVGEMITRLPNVEKEVLARLPSAMLRNTVERVFEWASFSNPESWMKLFVSWGATIANALMQFLIVLIVGVYFLADGERVYRWLLAFLPEVHRKKVAEASPEIATVVSSYMLGQLITSLLCGAYVFVILSVLKVPEPTVLAVIAGVFDILPLVGFFLSLIPALIVAFSVSTGTAGLVLVLYSVYHLVENYFIVPRVYGNRLRLSTLTVLVTCMAGALIAGVIGVIAVLPLVACYPIVERIWLKRHFEPDTVAKHEQIDAEEHPSK